MDSHDRQRELVFCHQCSDEWYRDEHGLTCPACHSEFTEVIEPDHDPREDQLQIPADDPPESVPPPLPPHPLRDHNPWANIPDHEDDGPPLNRLQWQSSGPGRVHITGTFVRPFSPNGSPGARSPQPNNTDPFSMLAANFGQMMQSIAAGQVQGPGHGAMGGGAGAGAGGPGVSVRSGHGPGYAWTSRTSSARLTPLTPRNANQPQPPDVPVDDLQRILSETLFGPMNPHGPGPGLRDPSRGLDDHDGPFPRGPPPLLGFLLPLLNPANAAHGDAVYTQEAFDRILSQLMEQNNMGNAPGPASAESISELPKIKITKDMVDPKTGQADCSICMEDVEVGGEVTRLWCGHWFHGECVGSWLREHDSCPQCRMGITQARDQAQGRSGANVDATATASTAANGAPQPSPWSGRRTSSSASQQNAASGVNSPSPAIPGAFGYPEANADEQSRRQSGSQRSSHSREGSTPGFAERVRGLFGRGSNSNSNPNSDHR
ncbi:hypothetical protein NA57DRAFT_53417 [Rhizodiscina lignyota]|uniref:RING-type E3 ubiquitin transferase n=1 Tax=Rhizodiscina lignyota TaxID=1504668 RepID=A0A9P4IL75_9PEZI|nr:hypothetical protein NA57DRAFT_53417 [Rhizodiscina lignyota]